MSDAPCDSRYSVGQNLTLECDLHQRTFNGFLHSASHGGIRWTWDTREEDSREV